ncbi:hypothetical protein Y88_2090 [Novosphingobium nitrogenifigens DSM 19370]|uniref:Uncharacterized protein n=1 Tax=Novosphingobium nitrogenifigens DSM 19370 TaxID=983920 RepID=F1Z5V6_9SPHN|nr:hypothetical protein Y88_2090 [Novosphingobium nitrogenifigens DSM 19370]
MTGGSMAHVAAPRLEPGDERMQSCAGQHGLRNSTRNDRYPTRHILQDTAIVGP